MIESGQCNGTALKACIHVGPQLAPLALQSVWLTTLPPLRYHTAVWYGTQIPNGPIIISPQVTCADCDQGRLQFFVILEILEEKIS